MVAAILIILLGLIIATALFCMLRRCIKNTNPANNPQFTRFDGAGGAGGGGAYRPPMMNGASVPRRTYDEHRAEVVAFYTEHNPSKVGGVDEVLGKWKGREEQLRGCIGRGAAVDNQGSPRCCPTANSRCGPSGHQPDHGQPREQRRRHKLHRTRRGLPAANVQLCVHRCTQFAIVTAAITNARPASRCAAIRRLYRALSSLRYHLYLAAADVRDVCRRGQS